MAFKTDLTLYRNLMGAAQKHYDKAYASGYRERDNDVENPMHADLSTIVAQVSSSFGRPITVLDLGCGTGRYFHCLQNTVRIVGVDASLDMLAEAKRPVGAQNITGHIDLVCGNIFDTDFPPKLFDMVYCLGVFGDWCGVSPEFLGKVRRLLKVDGKFIFTVIDAQSPQATSLKRTLAGAAKPFLPPALKRRVDERLRPFRIFEADLRELLDGSSAVDYEIARRYSGSGRIDLVCVTSFTP